MKKNTNIQTWVLIAIVVVIFAGIYGVVQYTGQVEQYAHNGFVFTEVECGNLQCWQTNVVTNVAVHPITFYYGPRDVENVPVDIRAVERTLMMTRLQNSSIVIVFDEGVPGDVGVAATQISRVVGERLYNVPTRGAVFGDVTCADNDPLTTVIYITQGFVTGVTFEDNGCIIVQGRNPQETIQAADAFTLHLLSIL